MVNEYQKTLQEYADTISQAFAENIKKLSPLDSKFSEEIEKLLTASDWTL